MEDSGSILRHAPDRRTIDEWSLVLSAAAVDHRVEPTTAGFALVVESAAAARAERLLSAYDAEGRAQRPPPPATPEYGPTWVGLLLAAALVVSHGRLTGDRATGSLFFERGAASAERILDGEMWRVVTALTLHADLAHVAANAAACAVFGTALFRAVGPGVGLWLLLLAGAGGNLLNALLHGSAHSAVGASTAVFGGLGALGSIQLVRRRRSEGGWRAWAPLGAALALLAWLGSGPNSDVVAHLLGFIVGAILGVAAGFIGNPPRFIAQLGLAIAAVTTVAGCWAVALVSRS